MYINYLVQKMLRIERFAGSTSSFEIMKPFSLKSSTKEGLEDAENRMGKFIGLENVKI